MAKGLLSHIDVLDKMDADTVDIGWFEENVYTNGIPVAQVMMWNEFGQTIQMPAREQTIYRKVDKDGNFSRGGKFVKRKDSNFASTHSVAAHTIVIPARPLMRQSAEKVNPKVEEFLARRVEQVLRGEIQPEDIAKKLGEAVVNTISKEFDVGGFQDNAASTITKKGFNKPLIDTGNLSQSIQYKINRSGE